MSKKNVKDMMSERSPIGRRPLVEPVDLYTNPQTDNPVVPLAADAPKRLGPQADSRPNGEEATQPVKVKYTSHLYPESIKALKVLAAEREVSDYKLMQEAVDDLLAKYRSK